jgi:hypothetical protein
MDKQTKLVSAIETFCNIGSGFILSLILWQFLAYVLGIPMPLDTNVFITSCFTVLSLTRSYLWRRFFARGLHETVAAWVGRLL